MVLKVKRKNPPSKVVVSKARLPPRPVIAIHVEGDAPTGFLEHSASEAQLTIRRYKEKIHNPMSAIRAHCVECSGGSLKEVAECRIVKCSLHPFRTGTNPFHKKTQQRLGLLGDDAEGDDETQ
jgi:hypothetical protein